MDTKIMALALFIILFFAPDAWAKELQVGVSPLHRDMGELAPGSDNYAAFSLVTQSPDELLVGLGALRGNPDFFLRPQFSHLDNISSEEDASGWVSFPANPIIIRPENGSQAAGTVRGWRSAGFTVRVPRNAEPCYHSFQIKPAPYTAAAYDTGVNIAAITVVTVYFKVQGNCTREGTILDIQQGADHDKKIGIDTYFRNTGTATVSARATEIQIRSENGSLISTLASDIQLVAPKKTAVLRSYLDPKLLEPGEIYNVTATVSYGTGTDTKSVFLALEYAKPSAPAIPSAKVSWAAYTPDMSILLVLLILIVSYFIYTRK